MKIAAGEEHVELIPETDFERDQLRRVARFAHLCTEVTIKGPTGTVLLLLKVPEMDESHVVGNLKARAEREKKHLLAGKQIMLNAMDKAQSDRPYAELRVDPLYIALQQAFAALPDVYEGTIAMADV